jgi:hypothetical protein
MAITPTAADPFGLGTDIALLADLNPVWGLVSGFTNLGYAIARRLNAVLGSLFYDLGYGFDLNDLVNQDLLPGDVGRIAQAIAGQCLLDERVQTCRATLSFDNPSSTLTIIVSGTIPTGQAFQFILSPNGLTVALISVNGQAVTTPAPATVSGPSTVIIQNGTAEAGPAGPPGPSGSASQDIPIADVESSSGSEEAQPQTQKQIAWDSLPATVTLALSGMFSSAAGTATFRLRVNGSDGIADGTIELTITSSVASPPMAATASVTISNPGGLGRVIITAESSGAAVACAARDLTLTIR